jgi:hypothetical protein
MEPGNYESALPRNGPSILFREIYFDHADKNYKVDTFSDTAQAPNREQCFRYEVQNESQRDIRQFLWRLAEIRADLLPPGRWHRKSKVKIRSISENPIDVRSPLLAFENITAETRAWAPRGTTTGSTQPFRSWLARGASLRPDDVTNGLDTFLRENKLPTTPIKTYYLSESGIRTPTSADHYSAFGFEFHFRSEAIRSGDEVWIVTSVQRNLLRTASASLWMPALSAQEAFQQRPEGLDEYRKFLDRFRSTKVQGFYLAPYNFFLRIPIEALKNDAVYLMEHPVWVATENSSECFMVGAYVPLPLNFSLDNCAPTQK